MNLTNNGYDTSLVLESLIDSEEISKRFQKILNKFLRALKNTQSGSTTISYGGRPVKAVPADIVRIGSELKQKDFSDLLIRNIILSFIVSSEKRSAYSGVLLLDMLMSKFVENDVSRISRCTSEQLSLLLRKFTGFGICTQIIETILEINPNASLDFKVNKSSRNFRVSSDYSLKVLGYFPASFEAEAHQIKGFYPVFVDGKIEKVSEIDSLLRSSHENGQTILLMARDFSPDVVSTLNHNYKSKKLKVLPFVFSEENSEKLESENIKTFDSENFFAMRTFDVADLKKGYDGNFYGSCMHFHGAKGLDRHVTVNIPGHFKNQAGLIEDRVRSGITFALEVCKSGIIVDPSGTPIAGQKQFKTSSELFDKINNFEMQLGGLIVLD